MIKMFICEIPKFSTQGLQNVLQSYEALQSLQNVLQFFSKTKYCMGLGPRTNHSMQKNNDGDDYLFRRNSMNPPKIMLVTILCLISTGLGYMSVYAQVPSDSPVIDRIVWGDPLTDLERRGTCSDNWPITWGADGHLYTVPQDGWGFEGYPPNCDETPLNPKISMGFSRIAGPPDNFTGTDIWDGDPHGSKGDFDGKSLSLISIDGTFYQLIGPESDSRANEETRVAWWDLADEPTSMDWHRIDDPFFEYTDGFAGPAFLNFEEDYEGARDDYVYFYSPDFSAGPAERTVDIIMGRVWKSEIRDRSSYEFYSSTDPENPTWSPDIADRVPIFHDDNEAGFPSVTYNKGLRRYIMVLVHGLGNLGILDAPEPWGPWTKVEYTDNWMESITMYSGNIPTKTPDWISDDGKNFHFVFLGINEHPTLGTPEPIALDAYQHLPGTFEIINQAPNPVIAPDVPSGTAPLEVNFLGSGSSDPEDGPNISYEWKFEDDRPVSTEQNPSYTFTDPGTYTVSLKVTDSAGATAARATVITVHPAQTPSITLPNPGSTFTGSSVTFQWEATEGNVTQWELFIGSAAGEKDYHDSESLGTSTSTTVNNLPTDGSTIHVQLRYKFDGGPWQELDEQYTAHTSGPPTPVLYLPFDEASGDAMDQSGNGNNGTLQGGATRVPGQNGFGSAMQLNGSNAYVEVAHSPTLGLTDDLTIALWIKATTTPDYGSLVAKTNGTSQWDYDFYIGLDEKLTLYGDDGAGIPTGERWATSNPQPQLPGSWYHVAVTRSGSSVTFYLDGNEVGTKQQSGQYNNRTLPIWIGSDGDSGDAFFDGLIDEVKVFDEALDATEIGAVMTPPPGNTPPSQPGSVVFSGVTASNVTLSWAAATDAEDGQASTYEIRRCTGPGCANFGALLATVMAPTLTYPDTTVAAGTTYRYQMIAIDSAGLAGPARVSEDVMTSSPGNTPPSQPGPVVFSGIRASNVTLSWTAASDAEDGQASNYEIQRCMGPGCANFGALLATVMAPTLTYPDTTVAAETTYRYQVIAKDSSGLAGPARVSADVTTLPTPVLHLSFDEPSGDALDQSGNGNDGTLQGGATRAPGQQGQALQLDGINDYVAVAQSSSLDLTGDLTIALWIKATTTPDYGSLVAKTNGTSQWDYDFYIGLDEKLTLYGDDGAGIDPKWATSNPQPQLPGSWHHVAVTRSGSSVTFYLDGNEVGTKQQSGQYNNRTLPIRIGSDGDSGDAFFDGLIDEVHVYDRALNFTQVDLLATLP